MLLSPRHDFSREPVRPLSLAGHASRMSRMRMRRMGWRSWLGLAQDLASFRFPRAILRNRKKQILNRTATSFSSREPSPLSGAKPNRNSIIGRPPNFVPFVCLDQSQLLIRNSSESVEYYHHCAADCLRAASYFRWGIEDAAKGAALRFSFLFLLRRCGVCATRASPGRPIAHSQKPIAKSQ